MGRREEKAMSWIEKYAADRSNNDPEFKAAYEEQAALLALVRARQEANLTQHKLAETLHVSQPYIAQIERGSKPISLAFMVRYANAVGVSVQVSSQHSIVTA